MFAPVLLLVFYIYVPVLPYHIVIKRCSPTGGVMQECKKSFFADRYLRLHEANHETIAKGHRLLWNTEVRNQLVKHISS